MRLKLFAAIGMFFMCSSAAFSQTTGFTYQGRLDNGGTPANGSYEFEFTLFDALTNGSQVGPTISLKNIPVTSGAFTVQLDFGAGAFNGGARFLQLSVQQTNGPGLTILAPRQPVTATPYSIRSLSAAASDSAVNATQLGGVAANQYVLTSDTRLSDARPPTAGSSSYIQNRTTAQAASDFNISGDGTVGGTLTGNIVSATTQFNIGINHALSLGASAGVFAGRLAGASNTTGSGNSFFGDSAGRFNSTAANNSFFGRNAGTLNTASDNSFFGTFAGDSNTTGTRNSFFGVSTGDANNTGNDNSFFGYRAGRLSTANGNSFLGANAGNSTTGGGNNSFFGYQAGTSSTAGNSVFFGSQAGLATTSGGENTFIGTFAGASNITGNHNTLIGEGADVLSDNLKFATAIGAGAIAHTSNEIRLGRDNASDFVVIPGILFANGGAIISGISQVDSLQIESLGAGGSTSLCLNSSNFVSTCSSSLRYKTSVHPFLGGLDVVRRLHPITFNWKDGGMADVGFGAEEVEKIEPLLTTRNAKGAIEGVKYGQLTTVLVNAVQQQQQQIAAQQLTVEQQRQQLKQQESQIRDQQLLIVGLKNVVCRSHPRAAVCK